jgi:hypothetical protein
MAHYDTEELVQMFQALVDEGYSGLSLDLIIDLIEQRCTDITPERESH